MSKSIFKIADYTNKTRQNPVDTANSSPSQDASHELLQSKAATLKLNGQKEINKFRKATEDYLAIMESTALFAHLAPQIREQMLDYMLDFIMEPIIRGERIPGLDQEHFNTMRREMYFRLITKYQ